MATEYEVRYGGGPVSEGRRFTVDQYPDAVTFFSAVVMHLQTDPEVQAAWASITQRDGEAGKNLLSWTKISEDERPLAEGEVI